MTNNSQISEEPLILAIDDDESNLLLLRRPLVKEGYRLMTAQSGVEGMELLKNESVDLVLLDWMMPGMSGLDVCAAIRSDNATRWLPVILVTAKSSTEELRTGLEAGANDFIRKPVDKLELVARIRAALRESAIQKKLVAVNRRLEELDVMKNEFLAVVSHDLRSPLAAIHGFASILLEGREGDDQRRSLEIIRSLADRQLKLIETLLDIGRIEAGKVELERCPLLLGELVNECVESIRSTAILKEIRLVFNGAEAEKERSLDRMAMEQVVNNLLSNALKFTHPGGAVTVSLVEGPAEVTLMVEDNGGGIDPEKRDKLFHRFTRLKDEGTAGEKGTGLGLAITRELVEKHGGSIHVESEPGKGSRFIVILPDNETAATEGSSAVVDEMA